MAVRHPLALLLATSLLAACQVTTPGTTRPFTPSFRLQAPGLAESQAVAPAGAVVVRDPATGAPIAPAQAGMLTVRFDHLLAQRAMRLLATKADVDRLTIKLSGNGVSHTEPITKAMLLAGQTSFTFTGLPIGTLTVTITAYDATNAVIGLDVRDAVVMAGQTTVVASTVLLTPTVPASQVIVGGGGNGGSGGGATGTVAVAVDLVDDVPVIVPAVRGIFAPDANEGGPQYFDVELDGQGNAWFTGNHSADVPAGTASIGRVSPTDTLTLFPVSHDSGMALTTNVARDRIYVSEIGSGDRISALSTAGAVLGTFPLAGDSMAVAPDGTLYAAIATADPTRIAAVAPTAGPLDPPAVFQADPRKDPPGGTYVLSMPVALACDATGHVVSAWLATPQDAMVDEYAVYLRRQAPDGTLVFETRFPPGAGPYHDKAMALDAQGNIWIPRADLRAVEKYAPAGALLGTYPVGLALPSIHIDPAGRVWVYDLDGDFIARLAPTGEVQAYYHLGADVMVSDLAVSADDHMWLVNMQMGLLHLKLDPLP